MPRHPSLSPGAGSIFKSVFARVAERLRAVPGEVFPLHIGDTYLDPIDDALFAEATAPSERIKLARYAHPHGTPSLCAKLREGAESQGLAGDEVVVTAGATHALYVAAASVLAPGDEVLVCAPYWPLFPGVLRTAGAVPVEVPFFDLLASERGTPIAELLLPYLTERTAAVYFNSPNNPTGVLLRSSELAELAAVAVTHQLWIFADEVYGGFGFSDEQTPLIGALPGARGRTLSAFSFSKSLAMAGYRVGCLTGPRDVIDAARKVSTHSVYSVSGIGQSLAERALDRGPALVQATRDAYRRGADVAHQLLRAKFTPSEGGGYVFLDLRGYPSPDAILERALERGVALSPGDAFGPSYGGYARLCYTAVPPDALARAIHILNEVLAGAA